MTQSANISIESLEDLRAFVSETLGDHEQLAPGAFPLTERLLHRGGRPCGIQFCLVGPRSVRLTAIWEIESQSVLFYDSTGERFQRVQLNGDLAAPSTE
jgi:hypothetical protein